MSYATLCDMLSVDEDVDAAVTGFAVIRLSLGQWPSFSLPKMFPCAARKCL